MAYPSSLAPVDEEPGEAAKSKAKPKPKPKSKSSLMDIGNFELPMDYSERKSFLERAGTDYLMNLNNELKIVRNLKGANKRSAAEPEDKYKSRLVKYILEKTSL